MATIGPQVIFKAEVTQGYQTTFYVDANNADLAGEVASEVAESIDCIDWDQHGFEDVNVQEVVVDPSMVGSGSIWERRRLRVSLEGLLKSVRDDGLWVGGADGEWHHNLDYLDPQPPVDPNQGVLPLDGPPIIEETPPL